MEVGVHILYWYMYKEMYYSTLKYHSNALEMTVCIQIFLAISAEAYRMLIIKGLSFKCTLWK